MLNLVESRLLDIHKTSSTDPETDEAIAWLCKALGKTGNSRFIPTLEKILAESKQKASRRWANKSLMAVGG